ncbi:MAG: hypothetical protein ACE5JO_08025 [Candidatus Binatia bacterium]
MAGAVHHRAIQLAKPGESDKPESQESESISKWLVGEQIEEGNQWLRFS